MIQEGNINKSAEQSQTQSESSGKLSRQINDTHTHCRTGRKSDECVWKASDPISVTVDPI